MSNQPKETDFTQTPGQDSGSGATVQGVTREEFDRALQEILKKVEKNWREIQSRQDSFESRVRKNLSAVEEVFSALSAQGVQVDPSIQQKMRQDAMLKAFQEEQSASQQTQSGPTETVTEQEEIDPVIQAVLDYMNDQGIMIEDSDPEAADMIAVIESGASPGKIMAAAVKAVNAKRERLSKQQNPAMAAARSPTLGAGGQPASSPLAGKIVSPDQLWQEVEKSWKPR